MHQEQEVTDNLNPVGCAACNLGEKFTEERAFIHTGTGAFCKGKKIGVADMGPVEYPDDGKIDGKVSGRVCSKCGRPGHNSRTCTGKPKSASPLTDGAPTVGGSGTEINALAMGIEPASGPREPGRRVCGKCGYPGHYASTCGKPRTGPPTVGAPSVSRPAAVATSPSTPVTNGKEKCWKCGAAGHSVEDCWVTARDNAKRTKDTKELTAPTKKVDTNCTHCRSRSHTSEECPSNPNNPECDTCGMHHTVMKTCPNAKFFK